MRETGWGLICLGLFLLLGAFLFVDVSRDIGYIPSASEYLPSMPREVANVHAMHIQSLVFHAGLISFLAGVVCIGAATIDEAIRRKDPKADASAATPPQSKATNEEVAAAAAYLQSTRAEPDKAEPDSVWPMLIGAGIITLVVIGVIVASSGERSSGSTAPNAVSDIQISNDVIVDQNLTEAEYPNLVE